MTSICGTARANRIRKSQGWRQSWRGIAIPRAAEASPVLRNSKTDSRTGRLSLAISRLRGFWLRRKSPLSEWQIAGKRVTVGQIIDTAEHGGTTLEAPFFGEVRLGMRIHACKYCLRTLGTSAWRCAAVRALPRAGCEAPQTASFFVETPSAKTKSIWDVRTR